MPLYRAVAPGGLIGAAKAPRVSLGDDAGGHSSMAWAIFGVVVALVIVVIGLVVLSQLL